jgi:hypothetical protein
VETPPREVTPPGVPGSAAPDDGKQPGPPLGPTLPQSPPPPSGKTR